MEILAIDLGMSKSVYCVFDTAGGEVRFGRFVTNEERLRGVLGRLRPDRVVAEICPLAAMVHDVSREMSIEVEIADTTQDAWQWRNVKRKTDEDNALKLARLSALGQINRVHIPSLAMRQWRKLIEHRVTLVDEQTRCKNRIRALLVCEGLKLPSGKNGWTRGALATLNEEARSLSACEPEALWRGMLEIELRRLDGLGILLTELEAKLDAMALADRRTELVRTVPGVGTRTAEVIVTVLDDAKRFRNLRAVSAYAGLTPRRYQSGNIDRQGRISKRGNPLLRRMLNQAAWSAVRCDPRMRDTFMRICGGKRGRKKQAIVAVMRKLLVVCWAVMRDERAYERRSGSSGVAA